MEGREVGEVGEREGGREEGRGKEREKIKTLNNTNTTPQATEINSLTTGTTITLHLPHLIFPIPSVTV